MFLKYFAALLILTALVSGIQGGKTYEYQYQKIINVEPTLELTINNANGSIILTANDEYKLKVDAVKKIYSESKEEADLISDHVQISVTASEGHILIEPRFTRIRNTPPSFWDKLLGKSGEPSHGSVDFIISVPVDCNADIYNSNGNIEVAGLRGHLLLSNAAGGINVRDIIGNLDIAATSGHIILAEIEGNLEINATNTQISFFSINGDLEIKNNSGETTGEYLIGDLTMTKTVGRVELQHIEGDVRIQSTSGEISILQEYGALDISNETGDIAIKTELNSLKDYYIQTTTGSIEFIVPEDSNGRIKMEVGSGDIDAQIPIAIESFSKTKIAGSFGNEGPKILLATGSGDITLAEF